MGGTNGLSNAGLIRDTWKVGCTLIDLGSLSRTAAGLMILEMGNGPINRGANLWDFTRRGMSRVDSQTLLPAWYVGAGVCCRSAIFLARTELLRRTSRTSRLIFLGNKEEPSSGRRGGRSNKSCRQGRVNIFGHRPCLLPRTCALRALTLSA